MAEAIYLWIVAGLLLLSGAFYIVVPASTERWMSRVGIVRIAGAVLLALAVPCLAWRGWCFWTLFAGLSISGSRKLCIPQNSIRAQRKSYPRWVHGCLLVGGAILVLALWPFTQ